MTVMEKCLQKYFNVFFSYCLFAADESLVIFTLVIEVVRDYIYTAWSRSGKFNFNFHQHVYFDLVSPILETFVVILTSFFFE